MPDPTMPLCICGHDERHHVGVLYSSNGRYCQWRGCGCPQLVSSPPLLVSINGVPATWSNEKQSWVPCWEPVETRGPKTPREIKSAVERGLENLHAYDCWDSDHTGCIEIVRAVLSIPRPKCSVPCDADCDQLCHEAHNVRRKREHEPEDCPAVVAAPQQADQAQTEPLS